MNVMHKKQKKIWAFLLVGAMLLSGLENVPAAYGAEETGTDVLPVHVATDTAVWTGEISLNRQTMTSAAQTISENMTEFCGKGKWSIWNGGGSKDGWAAANMSFRMDLSAYTSPVIELEGTLEGESDENVRLPYQYSSLESAETMYTEPLARGNFSQKIPLENIADSYFFFSFNQWNLGSGDTLAITRVTIYDSALEPPVITDAPIATAKPVSYPTHSAVDRASWTGSVWINSEDLTSEAVTAESGLDAFCGKDNWAVWSGAGTTWVGANIHMGMDLSAYVDPVARVTIVSESDRKNGFEVSTDQEMKNPVSKTVMEGQQEYTFALSAEKPAYFGIAPKADGVEIVKVEIYDRSLSPAVPTTGSGIESTPSAVPAATTSVPAGTKEPSASPAMVLPAHAATDTAVWTGTLMVDTEQFTSSRRTQSENLTQFCGSQNWGGWNGGSRQDGYVSANMYMNMDLSAFQEPVAKIEGTLQCENSTAGLQYTLDEKWSSLFDVGITPGKFTETIKLKNSSTAFLGISPQLNFYNKGTFTINRITIYDNALSQPEITDAPVVTDAPAEYPTHSALDVGSWYGRLRVDKTLMAATAETKEEISNLSQFCGSDNLIVWAGSGSNWVGAQLEAAMDLSSYEEPVAMVSIRAEKDVKRGISWTMTEKFQNWNAKDVEEGTHTYLFSLDAQKPAYFGIQPQESGITVLSVQIGERQRLIPEPTAAPTVSTGSAMVTDVPAPSIPASYPAMTTSSTPLMSAPSVTTAPVYIPDMTAEPMPTYPGDIPDRTNSPAPATQKPVTQETTKPTKSPQTSTRPGGTAKPTKHPQTSTRPGGTTKPTKSPQTSTKPGETTEPTKRPQADSTAEPSQAPDSTTAPSQKPESSPEVSVQPSAEPVTKPTTNPQGSTATAPASQTAAPSIKPAEKVLEPGMVLQAEEDLVAIENDGESVSIIEGDDTASSVTISKVVVNGTSLKVIRIGKNAYKGNKKLKKLTIKGSVKFIGKNAFSGCKKLKKIVFTSKKVPAIGKDAFKNIDNKAVFYVPKKSLKKYKKALKASGGFKKTMRIVGK